MVRKCKSEIAFGPLGEQIQVKVAREEENSLMKTQISWIDPSVQERGKHRRTYILMIKQQTTLFSYLTLLQSFTMIFGTNGKS